MGSAWFTDEGERGELTIENRDGAWFVVSPTITGETKCFIENKPEFDDSSDTQNVEVEVKSFRRGVGSSTNYLTVAPVSSVPPPPPENDEQPAEKSKPEAGDSSQDTTVGQTSESYSSNEQWELADFTGSGEYVDVEATIDAVLAVNKDKPRMPDVIGELTDQSVLNPVKFVVNDGVSHPYFDEGKRYRFSNVKDHYYKKRAEVQVVINKNTDFTEIE